MLFHIIEVFPCSHHFNTHHFVFHIQFMNAQDKIVTFLDGYMGKLKLMAQLGAQQYNSPIGIHSFTKDLFRTYMFHLTKQSGVFVGYFIYSHPYSERYAVTVVSTNNTLVYTYQVSSSH